MKNRNNIRTGLFSAHGRPERKKMVMMIAVHAWLMYSYHCQFPALAVVPIFKVKYVINFGFGAPVLKLARPDQPADQITVMRC